MIKWNPDLKEKNIARIHPSITPYSIQEQQYTMNAVIIEGLCYVSKQIAALHTRLDSFLEEI